MGGALCFMQTDTTPQFVVVILGATMPGTHAATARKAAFPQEPPIIPPQKFVVVCCCYSWFLRVNSSITTKIKGVAIFIVTP